MSDLRSLLHELGGRHLSDLTRALGGADEGRARTALSLALPAILAALQRNASRPEGARALEQALARDHDGSVLDDLGAIFGGGRNEDGDGILGHVLGTQRRAVEETVGHKSGLDAGQVSRLMSMVAPLVMGWLARARQSRGVDAGGLADLLGRETRVVAKEAAPHLGGLAGLLDRDGDGSVADDLGGIASGILGEMLKRR